MKTLFLADDPAFSGAVIACDPSCDQLLRQQSSTQLPAFSAYSTLDANTDIPNSTDIFSQAVITLTLGSESGESLTAMQRVVAASKAADVYLTASLVPIPRRDLALESSQDAFSKYASANADLSLLALHDTSENARTDVSPEQSILAAMRGIAWPFLANHSIVCLCISDLRLALEGSDFVLCWTSRGSDCKSAIDAGCREIEVLMSQLKGYKVAGVVGLPVGRSVTMADVDYVLQQVQSIQWIKEEAPVLIGSLYEKEPTSLNESTLWYIGFHKQIAHRFQKPR